MFFNENLGLETIDREYKECILYWNNDFNYDFKTILKLFKNGKWIYNETIKNTIKIYLYKYLPKYISAFSNTFINSGCLYIGVDDDGYVKGIPFKGELNIRYINSVINEVLKSLESTSDSDFKNKIRENLNVEIIKLKFNNEFPDNNQYNLAIKKFEEGNKSHEKYLSHKNRWDKILNFHQTKLFVSLNKERKKYRNYMTDNEKMQKKDYKHTYSHLEYLCDVPNYYDLIADLKIKKFKFLPGEKVNEYKNLASCGYVNFHYKEINDIILFYNFGRYKDFCIESILNLKPKRNRFRVNESYPKFILSQIKIMLHSWLSNNRNINLFVIKITINNKFKNNNVIYYNAKKRKYEMCFREINNKGPITIIM